jgi:hypothetical protein
LSFFPVFLLAIVLSFFPVFLRAIVLSFFRFPASGYIFDILKLLIWESCIVYQHVIQCKGFEWNQRMWCRWWQTFYVWSIPLRSTGFAGLIPFLFCTSIWFCFYFEPLGFKNI